MARRRQKARRARRRDGPSRLSGLKAVLSRLALGRSTDPDASSHLQEIKGLVLIGLSLWLFVSLATYRAPFGGIGRNWGGQAGFFLATWVYVAMGWSGYFLVFLGATWGVVLVARKRVTWPVLRIFGGLCFLQATAMLMELSFGGSDSPSHLTFGPGGYLALELAGAGIDGSQVPPVLVEKLGGPGLWILLVLSALIAFMLATEMAFYPAGVAFREWLDERRDERGESLATAVLGWLGGLFAGLWDFLRGADLQASMVPGGALAVAVGAARPRARSRARRSSDPATKDLFADADEEEVWEEDDDELEDDEDEDEDEEDEDDDLDEEEDEDEEDEEDEDEEEDEDDEEEDDEDEDEDYDADLDTWNEEVKPAAAARRAPAISAAKQTIYEPPTPPAGPWRFPPLDLLEAPGKGSVDDAQAIEAQAKRLEHALASFRVEASVVGAKVGPAVTLFELEVAQGTRMNKVTQLSQEIAAALRAKSVRIIAPIPGKSTIGIEVPNERRRVVRLAELISQKAYDKKFMALPLFLGMDAEGTSVVEDLGRMPHLLIAGTTGSGKSVCINTILASLLLTRSPHDVQLILIDPKMVELQMFASVPHLMLPVVSDTRQATNVLLWAVEKMEGRYELFKNASVRNIKSYNALSERELRQRLGDDWNEERTPRHVPYIVIVIDEMADLMMQSKKEAELSITRLAQKSRAVGIHVVVATQRPSTDVITGVLKGNLPTRIAFQVASKVDSRVILDAMGAEKLLGQGDMLYTPPQSSQIRRVQGALVEDHEIQGVVDFVTKESAPNFSQELVQTATGTAPAGSGGGGAAEDDLWDEAVRIILKSKRGSASLLQRALGIGYTRASRLIDLMTAEGIVGDHKGSKAREVLMSLDDWESMHGAPLK